MKIVKTNAILIEGYIPDSISNIPKLREIHLHDNLFSGIIPLSFFRNLKSLEVFNIHDNGITGKLQFSSSIVMPNLKSLILSDNEFFGALSEDLPISLPKLEVLKIGHNGFDGTVPISYSNFSNLIEFTLGKCVFMIYVPKRIK